MVFLYYMVIGIIFSIVYTCYYLEEQKPILQKQNASKEQIKRVITITFIITLIIYPLTIGEIIYKFIRKNVRKIRKVKK